MGGFVQSLLFFCLQVDGVVLAEWKDFQFNILADEVGETDEHGFAVPEVVFDKDAIGIDASCVALIRYLQIEIEVLVQFVEAADVPYCRFLPIAFGGLSCHFLTAHRYVAETAMLFGQDVIDRSGKRLPRLLHDDVTVLVEDAIGVVKLVTNLVGSVGFLARENAEGHARSLEWFVEFWGDDLAVDGELRLFPVDGNEVDDVVGLAEGFCGGPINEN